MGMGRRVVDALTPFAAKMVSPDSLVNLDASDAELAAVADEIRPNLSKVQPGDLILVRTPGRFYDFMRRVANHSYDHVSVVMPDKQVLHIGPTAVRLVPLVGMLHPKRRPMVLRPKLSDDKKLEYLQNCQQLLGQSYDTGRAYSLVARLAVRQYLNISLPLKKEYQIKSLTTASTLRQSLICSDALLCGLGSVDSSFIEAIHNLHLDYSAMNGATINDFLRIFKQRPDLMHQVHLQRYPRLEAMSTSAQRLYAKQLHSLVEHLRSTPIPEPLVSSLSDLVEGYLELPSWAKVVLHLLIASLYWRWLKSSLLVWHPLSRIRRRILSRM